LSIRIILSNPMKGGARVKLITLPKMGSIDKPYPIICAVDGPFLIICRVNYYPIICKKF